MNFTDAIFYIFLPITLFICFGIKWKSKTGFNLVIIASSSIFYGWWDYRFLGLLYYSTVIDFFAGKFIESSEDIRKRKAWLLFSLTNNLSVLFFFKYFNFFIDNLRLAGLPVSNLEVILPVGISFYTFQTMSYSIDVYRRELKAERSFLNFLYYTIFFPQLVAGPIVRAVEFIPQVQEIPKTSWDKIKDGIWIFLTGLVKKVLFANSIAPFVDHVFASPDIYSTGTIWLGVIAYSLQIFCDFSGYTDMAIGVAKMFGHSLVDNFNLPYISRSVTEFWRRWHMSLSRWIKDYIYVSLGGNRKGRSRTYLNLFFTMVLGGLWHGASWNFVIWGALHGAALGFEKFFHLDKKFLNGPLAYVRWATTMLFVMICWVFFRAKDLPTAFLILQKMLVPEEGIVWIQSQFAGVLTLSVAAHFVAHFYIRGRFKYFTFDLKKFWAVYLLTFIILGIIFLNPLYYNPFIYFQF